VKRGPSPEANLELRNAPIKSVKAARSDNHVSAAKYQKQWQVPSCEEVAVTLSAILLTGVNGLLRKCPTHWRRELTEIGETFCNRLIYSDSITWPRCANGQAIRFEALRYIAKNWLRRRHVWCLDYMTARP